MNNVTQLWKVLYDAAKPERFRRITLELTESHTATSLDVVHRYTVTRLKFVPPWLAGVVYIIFTGNFKVTNPRKSLFGMLLAY